MLSFVVLWIVDAAYTRTFARGAFYKQQWVNTFKNQSFDLVILGSSRSLTTIDTQRLQAQTGDNAVNLSLDGSGPVDQLCLLKIFLDNGNTAKRILFQVDHWALTGPGNAEDSYRMFLPFRHRPLVADELAEAFPGTGRLYRMRDRIPMAGYARNNAYWSVDKLVNSLFRMQDPPFDEAGSYLVDRHFPRDAPTQSIVSASFEPDFHTIDRVLALCHEKNIEVFMFTAPWFDRIDRGGWQSAHRLLDGKLGTYRDFGDRYSGRREFFYDLSHLNQRGARHFTDDLVRFLDQADETQSLP